MSKISMRKGGKISDIKVQHKDLTFTYLVANEYVSLSGRRYNAGAKELSISSKSGNAKAEIILNGKQIETVKIILKAAGEI